MIGKLVNTTTIWKAVERRPLNSVLAEMVEDGWESIDWEHGELTRVVLKRRATTAVLYAKNDVVGMIEYDC